MQRCKQRPKDARRWLAERPSARLRYPGNASRTLGELPSASIECRHSGDQEEDSFEHYPQVAGAIRAWAGNGVDFCHQAAPKENVPSRTDHDVRRKDANLGTGPLSFDKRWR